MLFGRAVRRGNDGISILGSLARRESRREEDQGDERLVIAKGVRAGVLHHVKNATSERFSVLWCLSGGG